MSSWNQGGSPDPYPPQSGYTYGPQDYPFGGYPSAPGPPAYPSAPPLDQYGPVGGPGRPATLGGRLLAKIIDGLLIALPFAIVIVSTNSGNSSTAPTWAYFVVVAAQIAYETYYVGMRGATIGKRLLRIKVVDAQSGSLLGPRRAFLRSVVQTVSNLALYAGYWSPLLDRPRFRGWHDKVAGDVVVSTR